MIFLDKLQNYSYIHIFVKSAFLSDYKSNLYNFLIEILVEHYFNLSCISDISEITAIQTQRFYGQERIASRYV